MQAIEAYGRIDTDGSLKLHTPLPLKEGEVKVIIMYADEDPSAEEQLWLRTVSRNPAFAFLHEKEEDIYSLTDGKPAHE